MKAIEEQVHSILRKFGVSAGAIQPDAKLVKDLRLDSLDVVELVIQLEDQFDIQIGDEEIEHFVTLRDVIAYLYARMQKNTGRAAP